MKKNMIKKLSVSALAAAMTMSLSVPAFAAGTLSFPSTNASGKSLEGHTYEIYQIFTGKYDETSKVLSDIKWGEDGIGTVGTEVSSDVKKALDDLNNPNDDGSVKTDLQKLEVIEQYFSNDNSPIATASTGESVNVEDDGYYLIRDKSNPTGENNAYTTYVVRVVGGTVTVEPKVEVPGFDKQVLDEDLSDTTTITGQEAEKSEFKDKDGNTIEGFWGETADHEINEKFSFRLQATIPNAANMDEYKSYKLEFHDTLADVITNDKNYRVKITETDGTETFLEENTGFTVSGTDNAFTVTIGDLKAAIGQRSIRGVKVELIYDAHLNENAAVSESTSGIDTNTNKAHLEYSNNPKAGAGGDKGTTPDDTVYVFTYDVKNIKTDGQNPLPNAKFKLYTTDNKEITLATKTENGVTVYYPTGQIGVEGETMVSPDDGNFRLIGLDDNTNYVLREIDPPAGYNSIEDMTISLSAEHREKENGGAELVKLSRTRNGENMGDQNEVINTKGSNLPETGGVGTTLFYALGGMMAAGAGITLATKKRVSKAKK